MLPAAKCICLLLIILSSASVQGHVMPRYRDTMDDFGIQPGMALGSAHYAKHQSPKTPLKIPQWTPATVPYSAAPGSGDGPARWRGQHVYTPKSNCSRCIQPTPTSSSTSPAPSNCHISTHWRRITETVTTCSPTVCVPPCLTLSTTFAETVVNSMCIRTIGTTYTTRVEDVIEITVIATHIASNVPFNEVVNRVPRAVEEVTVVRSRRNTSPCSYLGIQTAALDNVVTLSTDGNPCYSIAITPTVVGRQTCTLDVMVTSYGPGIGSSAGGTPTVDTDAAQLTPVTSSGTTCTFQENGV